MRTTHMTFRPRFISFPAVLLAACLVVLALSPVAFAAPGVTFSAASPASGAVTLKKPSWLSVRADASAPIISATMTLNGVPTPVNIEYPVGHFYFDEEQESLIWVTDDFKIVRLMGYNIQKRIVAGLNTVAVTVTSGTGTSSYSWSFNYGSAPLVSAVYPSDGAVLSSSPASISAGLTSPNSTFSSAMQVDGVTVPTAYTAGTKTFTYTPVAPLAAGAHTVKITAQDPLGGSVTRTWGFTVRTPMSTGTECVTCHSTYPAAHPLSGCAACHTRAYADPIRHGGQVPTAAGCTGDGVINPASACHSLDHGGEMGRGFDPFECVDCHSVTYPNVPRHTDASMTALHESTSTGCGPCHLTSLVGEHAKYPSAAEFKYQCDVCHGTAARQQVKDSIAGGLTACGSCHDAADHDATHAVTPAPPCGAAGCHVGATLTVIHSAPGCDGCHASSVPAVAAAIAGSNRDCSACHVGDPHPAAVHTAGGSCVVSGCHAANVATLHSAGPNCGACHAADKTPSLVCTTCHTGALHLTANHTSTETCDSCHASRNLVSIHGDNCATCHPNPAAGIIWNGTCSQSGCHPTSHTRFTTHQGEHDDNGPLCWDCHDVSTSCTACHSVYDRTPPVTTASAPSSYVGTATITLSRTDVGGSGVKTTYYQLDGGALSTGTTVVVAPPVSGTATHTLDFWSTDNGYNTETHKRKVFTVLAP